MSIEAMKQALDVLENTARSAVEQYVSEQNAITALRQAIEQAEKQEPVAWLHPDKKVDVVVPTSLTWFDKPLPLYTAPPRKEWVGLTDEEIVTTLFECEGNGIHHYTRTVEAKLKEKNT